MYYKCLNKNRKASISNYTYPKVGEKTPMLDFINVCRIGYHFTDIDNLALWAIHGKYIYSIEPLGKIHTYSHKYVSKQVRLKQLIINLYEHQETLFKYFKTVSPEYKKLIKYSNKRLENRQKYCRTEELVIKIILRRRKNILNRRSKTFNNLLDPMLEYFFIKYDTKWFKEILKDKKHGQNN